MSVWEEKTDQKDRRNVSGNSNSTKLDKIGLIPKFFLLINFNTIFLAFLSCFSKVFYVHLHHCKTIKKTKGTRGMRKCIFLLLLLQICGILHAGTKTAGIVVDSRVKYQHVTGFGGFIPSPQWAYWLKDAEIDRLFGDGDDRLGLNIGRLYIANNRNGWSAGVANARRAKKAGAFLFASPWSPPAEWKSNGSDVNGGELLEEHYADWAKFLNDYYNYMKGQGVTIDAISIQNEPDWKTSYQSCIWTGEKLARFIREYGHLIECRIIAPETVHFDRKMHDPILNDPEACERLDILGGHFYGWDGSSYPLAGEKGKEVWMTEYLINERQEKNNIDINWKDDGFLFARSVNDAMLADMSAWVHYSLKRYYGCLGDGRYGTSDNAITKRGYILSHYAKYVSGTTRIKHVLDDVSNKLSSSAYLTETGDSIVVMVINPSADAYNVAVNLPFYTRKGLHVATTETSDARKESLVLDDETYEPTVGVAPYSLNTYIFEKSGLRDDIGDKEDEGDEVIFSDRFDYYGASCIPDGWIAKYEGGIRHSGEYGLGPRIMGFASEGCMKYAFYFRTGDRDKGYVSYGEEDGHRVRLAPGKYSLSYSVVGWKNTPSITSVVQKVTGGNIASLSLRPHGFVSANGPSQRITNATDYCMDFEVTDEDDYVTKWIIDRSAGGYNEALVGNIRLVCHNGSVGAVTRPSSDAAGREVVAICDIHGRRHATLQKGINIIKYSDGSVRKVIR